MKIIGHPWIESPKFITIKSKDEIADSSANSILLFEDISESIETIKYVQKEGLAFGVKILNIKDALFAYNLDANYLLVDPSKVEEVQAIAQHYLFDTQIIIIIKSEDEIEKYAKMGIDGVIFSN